MFTSLQLKIVQAGYVQLIFRANIVMIVGVNKAPGAAESQGNQAFQPISLEASYLPAVISWNCTSYKFEKKSRRFSAVCLVLCKQKRCFFSLNFV